MKRRISALFLTLVLLICTLSGGAKTTYAKTTETRAIAIVFDNSGSMYAGGNKAWCQATYAMEVFASMLNAGDTLLIYPMHPMEVNGQTYSMESPYRITDSSQASTIRENYTPRAGGTPIETIDSAAEGVQRENADKKYLIVLTDGAKFHNNGTEMSNDRTKQALDERFQKLIDQGLRVMYLGICREQDTPNTEPSEYFVKEAAPDSADVPLALTRMCNRIFGRDTLPENHISGNTIDFDISMSKLIIFVQGQNVSGLQLSNASGAVDGKVSETTTKFGTKGCGNERDGKKADETLQGMMVTYENCDAGSYTIEYSGEAASIEVYYEPNADLEFVFTDEAGSEVNPSALYEGNYKVAFGMKDAKTGQLISSDLLGNPHYQGSYVVNGTETPIEYDGSSGEVLIPLKVNDSFNANLTVTFLGGYVISKDASDFGWPEDGVQIAPRPAGELKLEISAGADTYSLEDLESGVPYEAKVYYQGKPLSGDELKRTELKWDPGVSNADIQAEFRDDHYELSLHYKNPETPLDTACGECAVPIQAVYSAEGCEPAEAMAQLNYSIEDYAEQLQMEMTVPEDYIVISKMDESKPIEVKLLLNGAPLPSEELQAVNLQVDGDGLDYTVTANEEDSSYSIRLLSAGGVKEGKYQIKATAQYTDPIGKTAVAEKSHSVTLSKIPRWVIGAISLLLLLLLLLLILIILHIKVLPKKMHLNRKECSLTFDGEDGTTATTFLGKIEGKKMIVNSKYAGVKFGLSMDVKPGSESYLRKPQKRRSAEVTSSSVRKQGNVTIQEAMIGSVKYMLNDDGKLERVPKSDKPFTLRHGNVVSYSGMMLSGGVQKPFAVRAKLNFNKKK
ncbi:MAG: hypothetical protein Q4B22_10510 [Eubacteriales bacterium]|nr:hypothetical protein [Eubacteriales bacterium]